MGIIEPAPASASVTGAPPSKRVTLRANFAWTLASNLIYAAAQWGILSTLAKNASRDTVGIFALALAITSPVILSAQLHLRALQATDAKREFPFSDYLTLRLLGVSAAMVVIGCIAFAGYVWPIAITVVSVGLNKSVDSLSDVYHGLLHQHERLDWIAQSLILRAVLTLSFFCATFLLRHSLLAAIWASTIASLAVHFGFEVPRAYRVRPLLGPVALSLSPRWHPRQLRRLVRMAFPMGIAALLVSLVPNLPRYFIEHDLGTDDLAIYAAMAYLVVAGNTIVIALGRSISPRLATLYSRGEFVAFKQLLGKVLLVTAIAGAAAVPLASAIGSRVLRILYTDAYATRVDVFVWIVAGGALSYLASLLWQGITSARRLDVQMALFLSSAGVAAVLSWLLIPSKGLVGAGVAYSAAMLTQTLGAAAILQRAIRAPRGGR